MPLWLRYLLNRNKDSIVWSNYVGRKFKDSLYKIDTQKREKAAIWKLIASNQFHGLCNDWWNWIGIGIPLNLVDKSAPDGDIDLLIKIPLPNQTFYRAFEVKTTSVSIFGKYKTSKSLKEKKIDSTIAQMDKLIKFGVQQLFLLELVIAQAGANPNQIFSNSFENKCSQMLTKIKSKPFGYVVQLMQNIKGFHEMKSGVLALPFNLKTAPLLEPGPKFVELIKFIESQEIPEKEGSWLAIMYCKDCKKLVRPDLESKPNCPICELELI